MRAAILSNGRVVDYEYTKSIISQTYMFVCADGGGFHAAKMGLVPNALIGDFDSLDEKVIKDFEEKGTRVFRYKPDKDQTDTQLAVEYAVEKGANEVIFLGCSGSRIDHTYANISLLIWLMNKGIKGVMIDEYNEIVVTDRYVKISGKTGDLVSLLAITPRVSGVRTNGLKYGLEDGILRYDNTLGISNEFLAEDAEIWVKEGTLMVIKARD